MPGKVHDPIKSGGFEWADDVLDADRECPQSRHLDKVRCPICKRPVYLHCSSCKIQITACLCTLIHRLEPLEAYKLLSKQFGQTKAREMMAGYGYNMPLIPGLPM